MSGAGAGAAVRAGHLRKLKTMKKKYFVLRGETAECSARLEYYESEKKCRTGAAPRRVIPLKSCYNITRRLDLKQKHVIALFTREEQFCIVAENEQDLHGWLTAILKQHRNEDASEELLHPIQHVWQVNVQKKGLGATKNIQGLYNLCLTDKTLSLVKIKSHNNVISDLGIPERVEYSLKNIRRCGDSECFFYMEVGRQTATGAGELWMHTDDSNIAQSMHSTIYHAMRNCAKETENERDHIVIPKRPESAEGSALTARGRAFSESGKRPVLANEKGLCVGSCIRQCVCAATHSADESAAAVAPLATRHAENQPPNNSLTDEKTPQRVIKHHRTTSLPTGCPLFQAQEPLKICHERTRSAPLTGDEVDRVVCEKTAMHSSCKAVNGTELFAKKQQWSRRASTGTRYFGKHSPAHSKNAGSFVSRTRCETMPSRPFTSFESERPPTRHSELDVDASRDEPDSDWHHTPGIPEEPDFCDSAIRDMISSSLRGSSYQHSRTSSMGLEEVGEGGAGGAGGGGAVPAGYTPMGPLALEPLSGLVSASSGSVCSGTPSTDHRFSEYQLEPATSHIVEAERPPRAYSVGSRPAPRSEPRHRAYSVGSRTKPALRDLRADANSAPHLPLHSYIHKPRSSAGDLMELDFSTNSPAARTLTGGTPPSGGMASLASLAAPRRAVDEYVDMSPRYLDMRPGDTPATPPAAPAPAHALAPATPAAPAAPAASTPDGYVEMNYGRGTTRPIAITGTRSTPPAISSSPDDRKRRNGREARTPLGSQTIFPLSLDSPASPPEFDHDAFEDDEVPHHPLTTVREISEDGRRSPERRSPEFEKRSEEVASSPSYVKLVYPAKPPAKPEPELAGNPLANKTIARTDTERTEASALGATVVLAGSGAAARFSLRPDEPEPAPTAAAAVAPAAAAATCTGSSPASPGAAGAAGALSPLNYAALDLELARGPAAPAHRTYTQIDFARTDHRAP